MPISSSIEQKRIETYAQVLLEAAKAEGREAVDLEILKAAAKMPQELIDLFEVMSENGDLNKLQKVVDKLSELQSKDREVVTAEVTVAVPMTDELRTKVQTKLEADLGCEVYIIEKVDPKILGGLIIVVGDERRDVSVKTQLETMRSAMSDVLESGGDN